jgi:hypothetical protein
MAFTRSLSGRDERAYWQEVMQQLITLGQPDSWFYGWLLAGWQHGALSLWPCRNLVSHIGSGPGATHCQGLSPYLHLPLQPLAAASLRHPAQLQRDRQADRALYLGRRGGAERRCQHLLGSAHPWWLRISHLLRRVSSSLHSRLHPDLARKVRWRLRHERLPWMITCADKWAVKAWAAQRGVATAPTIAAASSGPVTAGAGTCCTGMGFGIAFAMAVRLPVTQTAAWIPPRPAIACSPPLR